jgi:hypothetical protein
MVMNVTECNGGHAMARVHLEQLWARSGRGHARHAIARDIYWST